MRSRSMRLVGLLMIVGLALDAVTAQAQWSFGLSAGIYQPEDNDADRTEVYGVRDGYRFGSNFGLEASLSRVDLADTFTADDSGRPLPRLFDFDISADLTNLDLSLLWFPRDGSFVVFGGPGIAQLDVKLTATLFGQTFSESDKSNILTAHAGLAYEWKIGQSFYLRPEARVRRYFDDEIKDDGSFNTDLQVSYKATDYEANLVFGWRFGR